MTVWGALLILLGIVAMLVFACVVTISFQKKHQDRHYDERQKAFQGRAYAFALVVGGIYYIMLAAYII